MSKPFLEKLIDLLKTDFRFVDENGELVRAAVLDQAWKINRDLVKLLLSDQQIKGKFFNEIEGHWLFNLNTFIEYISDKNFLANSYTRFRNKIGLNIDGKFLKERGEVCLVWPYKDCVLEGGQTKEEEKRKEIFFNEILAQDEIDRLFDLKVLTNWTRYTSGSGRKVEEIRRDENGIIQENLIIKGNNLLALNCIKNQFRGQVKLIYIDPPYNTGNDSFGYNDNFNHSSWLTFMKNRLTIAKEMLSSDGSIFISIDDNEVGYLQVLMDEIYGKNNSAGLITVKRGSVTGHKAINPGFVNICEYVIVYLKNKPHWKPNKVSKIRERNKRYNNFIINRDKSIEKWEFTSLLDAFATNTNIAKSQLKKHFGESFENEIFSFILNNPDAVIQLAYPDKDKVSKEAKQVILESEKNPGNVFHYNRENDPDMYFIKGQTILFYKDRLVEIEGKVSTGETISNLWDDVLPNDLHNEGGVSLRKGKKPEKLIQRILELASNEGDLVLDFFVGSGTTASVAMKMNRQFICVEQLDYINDLPKTRLLNTIEGEKSGISKAVNWQGGGNFIYCELMKYNDNFMARIQAAKTRDELVEIWREIAEKSFLNWYVNLENPKNAIEDFIEIGRTENGLDKQKKLLAELLNKNQLYVNLSEIDDAQFAISDEDKDLNRKFYGEGV